MELVVDCFKYFFRSFRVILLNLLLRCSNFGLHLLRNKLWLEGQTLNLFIFLKLIQLLSLLHLLLMQLMKSSVTAHNRLLTRCLLIFLGDGVITETARVCTGDLFYLFFDNGG